MAIIVVVFLQSIEFYIVLLLTIAADLHYGDGKLKASKTLLFISAVNRVLLLLTMVPSALSISSIIAIFIGIPSGSLCGGERYVLFSAEAPAGYPYKNSNNRRNRKRGGDHRSPRALFFFLPSLPTTHRGLCEGESFLAKNIQYYFFIYMYL